MKNKRQKSSEFMLTVRHSDELRILVVDGGVLVKVITIPTKAKTIVIKRGK